MLSRVNGVALPPLRDWLTEVNVGGAAPGADRVQFFGRNPNVGTGAIEDIWFNGGLYNFLTTAVPLRIRAGGNAADDAAGAGAREVTVIGLDDNWDPVIEAIVTAGASASAATAASFFRINQAVVTQSGTYGGANVGDMVVETTGGTIVADIEADFGATQLGIYSIRRNTQAWWDAVKINVDSNQAANVRINVRQRADDLVAPFGSPVLREFDGVDRIIFSELRSWAGPFVGPADIWASAIATGGGGTSVTAAIELYIQDTS